MAGHLLHLIRLETTFYKPHVRILSSLDLKLVTQRIDGVNFAVTDKVIVLHLNQTWINLERMDVMTNAV